MLSYNQVSQPKKSIKQKFLNLRGLYFRKQNYQAVLYPCKSVHTLMFKKNIDVAFVDKNFQVIKIVKDMPPWHVSVCRKSYFVIERFSNNKKFYKVGQTVRF